MTQNQVSEVPKLIREYRAVLLDRDGNVEMRLDTYTSEEDAQLRISRLAPRPRKSARVQQRYVTAWETLDD